MVWDRKNSLSHEFCNEGVEMKKLAIAFRLMSVLTAAVMVAYLAGCETTDDWDTSLTVTPSSVTSQTYPASITFSVTGQSTSTSTNTTTTSDLMNAELGTLSLPLTWSVSNAELGTIQSASGHQAVYVRTRGAGINIVTVQDQLGAQGIATVNQQSQSTSTSSGSLTLQATRPTIPNGENTSQVSVASGGTAPYTWTLENPPSGASSGGSVTPTVGTSVTYQSDNPGSIVVKATDSSSTPLVGRITITQD